jgi:hypothetical protein
VKRLSGKADVWKRPEQQGLNGLDGCYFENNRDLIIAFAVDFVPIAAGSPFHFVPLDIGF